jgi:hypothetical protein
LKEGDYFLIVAFSHRLLQAGLTNAQLRSWRNLRPFCFCRVKMLFASCGRTVYLRRSYAAAANW